MNFDELMEINPLSINIVKKVDHKDYYVCIDAGSTQTRSMAFSEDDIVNRAKIGILKTDTATSIVKRVPATIRPKKQIRENLECEVELNDKKYHFVKETMRNYLSAQGTVMVSNTSKVDQELLYQSVLFQTALNLYLRDIQAGSYADCYNVNLYLSLPPEDFISERIDKITNILTGMAKVTFPRLKRTMNICINDVQLYSEPEAAACRYINRNSVNDDTIIFLDCGGRSKGSLIVKNGTIIQDAIMTDFGGGELMLGEIATAVAENNNITIPSIDTIRQALKTGVLKIGNEDVSIIEEINDAKDTLSDGCVECISKLLDTSNTKIEEVQRVVCTGRTFLETYDENGKVISPSMVTNVSKHYENSPVKITFEFNSEDSPVVKGLYSYAVTSMMEG